MSADMGLTIDAVHLAMSLEHARAKMAAHNIATANVPGSRATRLDVGTPLSQLRAVRGDAALFAQTLAGLRASDLQAYHQPFPIDAPWHWMARSPRCPRQAVASRPWPMAFPASSR